MPTLAEFNAAPDDAALRAALHACCAAASWGATVAAGRPYKSEDDLGAGSDAATAALDDTGLAEALAGHPRIGERTHGGWSSKEQSGMADAADELREQLRLANVDYEARFGHVYLVCATGKSGAQMLELCRSRLGNDEATERGVVLGELAKINRIRLGKLLHEEP